MHPHVRGFTKGVFYEHQHIHMSTDTTQKKLTWRYTFKANTKAQPPYQPTTASKPTTTISGTKTNEQKQRAHPHHQSHLLTPLENHQRSRLRDCGPQRGTAVAEHRGQEGARGQAGVPRLHHGPGPDHRRGLA